MAHVTVTDLLEPIAGYCGTTKADSICRIDSRSQHNQFCR